jgi:pilus assembly protein Flp/PilA
LQRFLPRLGPSQWRAFLRDRPFETPVAFYELFSTTLQHSRRNVKFRTGINQPLARRIDPVFANLFFAQNQRRHMKRIIAKFLADESGATAIEYGLIAAGISIAIIVVVNGLGSNLNTKFDSINTSLK